MEDGNESVSANGFNERRRTVLVSRNGPDRFSCGRSRGVWRM